MALPRIHRDQVARWVAVATILTLSLALCGTAGLNILTPGPLSSAHGGVQACNGCHSQSGATKLGWLNGLITEHRTQDSKACLTCHRMPDTALNAHGARAEVLQESTRRLTELVKNNPGAAAGLMQRLISPSRPDQVSGPGCGTCHREHQGVNSELHKISNDKCQTCHVLKFESFDTNHPSFSHYPFERRTRIVFDHASHFEKHYPEVTRKDPKKAVPQSCSSCHAPSGGKLMAVAPFETTCATCHADQITGKERVSGPKGVAFLSLPGLDIETLNKKKAAIGEWPRDSDAALTPFMKVILSRSDKGRSMLAGLDGVNLQDLSAATDKQIQSVTELVWEIKRLLHELIGGKASDVLADLQIVQGSILSASLVGDLTAGLPRDVVVGAQQQWLPHLDKEIAGGPIAQSEPPAPQDLSEPVSEPSAAAADQQARSDDGNSSVEAPAQTSKSPSKSERDPPACAVRVLGSCLVAKDAGGAAAGDGRSSAVADEQPEQRRPKAANGFAKPMQIGLGDVPPPNGHTKSLPARQANSADELLFPSADELRELKARNARSAQTPPSAGTSPSEVGTSDPQTSNGIDNDVEPESWADVGGWYRQDHAIFYRPAGHKDRFMASWLILTAPLTSKDIANSVFTSLTIKDAPGSCSKCHSLDEVAGSGRMINFSPLKAENKRGQFTRFLHEPHLTIGDDQGCLTCHRLSKDRSYLKSYEQGSPNNVASNFDFVKQDQCQSCHAAGKARQDCQLCHSYHVDGFVPPAMQTKLPTK